MNGYKVSRENFHKLDDPKRELVLKKEKIFEALGELQNKSIADVGSGTGYYTKDLINLSVPDGTVYGIDINEELLEILKERTKDIDAMHYIKMTEASIPLDDNVIDSVLTVFTVHEFDDLAGTIKEIRRIMNKGGTFVIADWSPFGKLDEGPRKDKRIAKDSLINICKESGFEYSSNYSENEEIYLLKFNSI